MTVRGAYLYYIYDIGYIEHRRQNRRYTRNNKGKSLIIVMNECAPTAIVVHIIIIIITLHIIVN